MKTVINFVLGCVVVFLILAFFAVFPYLILPCLIGALIAKILSGINEVKN